jgi:hypothetical protein
MNYIGENDALFENLNTAGHIANSQIIGFNVYKKDFQLRVEVDFQLQEIAGSHMKLIFLDISEYAFYYSSDHIFYNVEIYKLLKKGGLYYISFDPEDGDLSKISTDDNDFILCGGIEGYFFD